VPIQFGIVDDDKNGFMACVHKMDRSKGLDLILHTPGGDLAAVESLVDYLRAMFQTNIRAIIPQLAMSGGTMMALAAGEILMGKHSSLGPIDPQINGAAAQAILEEFQQAIRDVTTNPASAAIWQPIIAKYTPTLVGACQKAGGWANSLATNYLMTGMFNGMPNAQALTDGVIKVLGSHVQTLSHSRHISLATAQQLQLKVTSLEQDQKLQDLVLTVHHACMHTLGSTLAVKIIENQMGIALIDTVQLTAAAAP
jgi:membrane-bound ClpP family serine protease